MATTDLSVQSAEYSLRNPAAGSPGRLLCLDIYRGLMVAGMIIVDNPGSDEHAYHARQVERLDSSRFHLSFFLSSLEFPSSSRLPRQDNALNPTVRFSGTHSNGA